MEATMRKSSVKTEQGLVPLSQINPGEVCYTTTYGFKLKVLKQSDFETEIEVLTAVREGASKFFVRSNTELVMRQPQDLNSAIQELIEVPEEVEKPISKKIGRPKKEITKEETASVETFERSPELARRGAIIDKVISFISTGPKDINEIVNFMYENKTHATKKECAAFFRASFHSEEKRAELKKIKPRIMKENDKFIVAK